MGPGRPGVSGAGASRPLSARIAPAGRAAGAGGGGSGSAGRGACDAVGRPLAIFVRSSSRLRSNGSGVRIGAGAPRLIRSFAPGGGGVGRGTGRGRNPSIFRTWAGGGRKTAFAL